METQVQSGTSVRDPGNRMYHILMSACGTVSALLFGAMGLLVCADVLARNIGFGSIQASVEITEYMLMIATFIAAPWLLYLGDHIRIDILIRAVATPVRKMLEILANLIGLGVSLLLAWQALSVAMDSSAQGGLVFKVLVFPEWWLNLPLLFGASLLSVEFVRCLVLMLRTGGQ